MENANKALIIAASTLIAVMLFGLFVSFISQVSIWPETQDQMKKTEQIAAFNAEYEVYQKSAMYGVDVISCLNKAKSNNEKYVGGGSFLGDLPWGETYEVNVIVTLDTDVKETIEVTAMQYSSSIGGYREITIYNSDTTNVKKKDNITNLKLKDVFKIDEDKQLTDFKEDEYLYYQMVVDNANKQNTLKSGTYKLIDSSVSDDENKLKRLLAHSNEPKQVIKNSDGNYIYERDNLYGWSTATWTTCLHGFKQKKFKCTSLKYSESTGRVNLIEFEEI